MHDWNYSRVHFALQRGGDHAGIICQTKAVLMGMSLFLKPVSQEQPVVCGVQVSVPADKQLPGLIYNRASHTTHSFTLSVTEAISVKQDAGICLLCRL